MCKSQTTSTNQTVLPPYVTDLGSYISNYGQGLGNNPPGIPLQQIEGLTGLQQKGFGTMSGYTMPDVFPESLGLTEAAATAGPQSVGVAPVDASTLNLAPYMQAATGPLQQEIQQVIEPAAAAQTKQLEAQANMEGGGSEGASLADPQALIAQSLADQQKNLQLNNAASTAYNSAFNSALNTATSNATQIQLPEEEANAAYAEQALQREATGAGNLLSDVSGNQNNILSYIQALLGTGGQQQAQGQAGLNALFTQQSGQQQEPFQIAQTLASLLGSERGTSDTTSTLTQPNNSLMSLLGSLGGGLLSNSGAMSSIGSGLGSLFSGAGGLFSSIGGGIGDMLSGGGLTSLMAFL